MILAARAAGCGGGRIHFCALLSPSSVSCLCVGGLDGATTALGTFPASDPAFVARFSPAASFALSFTESVTSSSTSSYSFRDEVVTVVEYDVGGVQVRPFLFFFFLSVAA